MPTYRTPTGWMHLKMAKGKAPAPCAARVSLGGTSTTFRCCAISSFLCDYVGFSGQTCDAPLCEQHAHQTGPDRHLCPEHAPKVTAGAECDAEPGLF